MKRVWVWANYWTFRAMTVVSNPFFVWLLFGDD